MQTTTDVAGVPTLLSTPPALQRVLAELSIAYREVIDYPGLDPACKVQAVLLNDSVGELMVLFAQSQLLDLNQLADLIGRDMTAVPADRLAGLLDKHQLRSLPGLPTVTASTCLYEEHLLHQPLLFISSCEPGLLLEVTVKTSSACSAKPVSVVLVSH